MPDARTPDAASLPVSVPTIAEVYDELREEYDALGLLSYHGAPWSDNGEPWMADLTQDDVEKIRALLRRTGAAIEGLS